MNNPRKSITSDAVRDCCEFCIYSLQLLMAGLQKTDYRKRVQLDLLDIYSVMKVYYGKKQK